MSEKKYNVLFLCTGNSARSIMAEAVLGTMGKGRFNVFSAGSMPNGQVNPFAIEKVQALGYPLEKLPSKSWDEYAEPGAPQMDFIITVCDNAAGEVCPVWPGQPVSAHWGFVDPATAQGGDEEKRKVFDKVFRQIMTRAHIFASLPLATLDKAAIQREMQAIGARAPE
ncbi:MAG: arsenate reductase ArsC [Rhodocyclaceae bacterium]|nr:arsenate reductase ArsC [Rhodocyclaceae bacterium]